MHEGQAVIAFSRWSRGQRVPFLPRESNKNRTRTRLPRGEGGERIPLASSSLTLRSLARDSIFFTEMAREESRVRRGDVRPPNREERIRTSVEIETLNFKISPKFKWIILRFSFLFSFLSHKVISIFHRQSCSKIYLPVIPVSEIMFSHSSPPSPGFVYPRQPFINPKHPRDKTSRGKYSPPRVN